MDDKLDIEAKEIIAIANSVEPLIEAYKRGELTEEEAEYLRAAMQSLLPAIEVIIARLWERLEPIMTRLGLWPVEEEE
jgi:hypothetical protein